MGEMEDEGSLISETFIEEEKNQDNADNSEVQEQEDEFGNSR